MSAPAGFSTTRSSASDIAASLFLLPWCVPHVLRCDQL